jgi:hypothetical protein
MVFFKMEGPKGRAFGEGGVIHIRIFEVILFLTSNYLSYVSIREQKNSSKLMRLSKL